MYVCMYVCARMTIRTYELHPSAHDRLHQSKAPVKGCTINPQSVQNIASIYYLKMVSHYFRKVVALNMFSRYFRKVRHNFEEFVTTCHFKARFERNLGHYGNRGFRMIMTRLTVRKGPPHLQDFCRC